MIHDHCVACNELNNLNQHHLIPKSLGGTDDETNIITLCGKCHAIVHSVKKAWNHSELTKKALAIKKSRFQLIGSIPYGYHCDDGVNLIVNKNEQRAISLIKENKGKGLSLRKIAKILEQEGCVPRGKSWHSHTISNIFNANN
jgi:hypothetical protein